MMSANVEGGKNLSYRPFVVTQQGREDIHEEYSYAHQLCGSQTCEKSRSIPLLPFLRQ